MVFQLLIHHSMVSSECSLGIARALDAGDATVSKT